MWTLNFFTEAENEMDKLSNLRRVLNDQTFWWIWSVEVAIISLHHIMSNKNIVLT